MEGEEYDKSDVRRKSMSPCLKSKSSISSLKSRVTFPEDDKDLVTAYLEPANPWDSAPVTPEDLIALYEDSCKRHETEPLEQVIEQLKTCYQPHPCLEVAGPISLATLEALETVLRRVRFHELRVKCCELADDAAIALFDILEYYESANTLSLSCDGGLGIRSWTACSRMLKKAHGLAELDLSGTPVNEQVVPVLCRAIKVGSKLTSLQLSRCGTAGRALVMLANALRLNSQLEELTLSDNDLISTDANQLANMLRDNTTLRYLDISNNGIGDAGCQSLCDALAEQGVEGGLKALVMWNTALTPLSASHLALVLSSNSPLETINIGQNQIGGVGLSTLKKTLIANKKLKILGIQSSQINCDGAEILAQIIEHNTSLQRVDARSNHIGLRGLTALQKAMHDGAGVQRLDLDDVPGDCQEIIQDIREQCRFNEARAIAAEEEIHHISSFSRKISLTCETLMRSVVDDKGLLAEPKRAGRLKSPAPSPVPSPSSSPLPSPSRHRFRVSKVSEGSSSPGSPASPISPVVSRFRVSVVEPDAEPPKPVVADGMKVQVGFETNPAPVAPLQPVAQPSRKISQPSKPQTGLEKLLGLFHNPSSLFSSVASVTIPGDKDKNTQGQESSWDWDWSCKDVPTESKNNNIE